MRPGSAQKKDSVTFHYVAVNGYHCSFYVDYGHVKDGVAE